MCILAVKQQRNLFERGTTRLHEIKVYNQAFNNQHNDIYEVVLPLQVEQADRVDILIKDATQGSEDETKGQSLSTDIVRQDLNGVADSETGPCEAGHAVEEEDHGENGRAGTAAACLGVHGAAGSPYSECDQHAYSGSEEEDSSANLVDSEGEGERDEEGPDCQAAVDERLLCWPGGLSQQLNLSAGVSRHPYSIIPMVFKTDDR